MPKTRKVDVAGTAIAIEMVGRSDYISLTDIAKHKNPENPSDIIKNWMRSKNTIALLGLWERLHNSDFKLVEFDQFKNEAGYNHFVLSPKKWIETTGAVGLIAKSGRYGGTFAHVDIAMEFASWVSVEFKLYLLKEFQVLKQNHSADLEWNINRHLTKINYRIHTDSIKENIIPTRISNISPSFIYASEADLLNLAVFGKTSKQWREENPEKDGNMRDYANVAQLVCLANLESLNAILVQEKTPPDVRLIKLNEVAIQQMTILMKDKSVLSLSD